MSDLDITMKEEAHKEECEREQEPKCEYYKDTGVILKDEWTGTDDSYEVATKCICQED